jgi:hypothetical protein
MYRVHTHQSRIPDGCHCRWQVVAAISAFDSLWCGGSDTAQLHSHSVLDTVTAAPIVPVPTHPAVDDAWLQSAEQVEVDLSQSSTPKQRAEA